MPVHRGAWIAIAIGGTSGALAAISRSAPPPPPRPAAVHAPLGSSAPRESEFRQGPIGSPSGAAPTVAAGAAANTEGPLVAAVSATGSAAAASPSAAPAAASVDLPPPPDTKAALLRAEMRCDQHDAAACGLASRAYEAGSAGVTDHEKAQKYHRIALTMWITQCDKNSPAACGMLARMYRTGDGVPVNEKSADALLARARELCHFNDAPICHEL